MRYRLQIQRDAVAEAVRARYTMVIPILRGMLDATKRDMVEALGGIEKITVEQFARIYIEQPGDYGICFEYAVHDAIRSRSASIHPVLSEVLDDFCGIRGGAESILFGAEKAGHTSMIETARALLTDESRILVGKRGQPPLLRKHLNKLVKAFRKAEHRERLPQSIRGLWKADLFIGSPGPDQWVATTLKINRRDLEAAPGLRIGLFPEERPRQRPSREGDLILCPLPYSGEFMQLFGASFGIIKQIVAAHGKQPPRAALCYEDDQAVAKWLTDRGAFPLVDVLQALEPLRQPGLLDERDVRAGEEGTTEAAAPIPLTRE
jgi:hypothetical protein